MGAIAFALNTSRINNYSYYAKKMINEIKHDMTIKPYMQSIHNYDSYTYQHCINVAVSSAMIGMTAHLSDDELSILIKAALLHDIGKQYINPAIINKPDKLSDIEYQIIKMHTHFGYIALENDKNIPEDTLSAICYHHENYNGSGYYGLSKNQIPLFAQIIHIADVYDALTTQRSYRKAATPHDAMSYIETQENIMFSTYLIRICKTIYDR